MLEILWYYIAWFACVYLAKAQLDWLCLALPPVSFWLLQRKHGLSPRRLQKLVGLAGVGIVFDAAMAWNHAIEFPLGTTLDLLPIWLVCIWFLFAAILPLTAGALGRRYALAAVLGAVFGPLSYYSGEALGVLVVNTSAGYLGYALFWALYFPVSLTCLYTCSPSFRKSP